MSDVAREYIECFAQEGKEGFNSILGEIAHLLNRGYCKGGLFVFCFVQAVDVFLSIIMKVPEKDISEHC